MKNLTLTVIMFFFLCDLYAQQSVEFDIKNFPDTVHEKFEKAKNSLAKGHIHFDKKRYEIALQCYLEANKFNPNNAFLNYEIALCYLYTHNDSVYNDFTYNDSAAIYLRKAKDLDTGNINNIEYYLGQYYQSNYSFDKALIEYNEFRQKIINKGSNSLDIKRINKLIYECKSGEKLMLDSVTHTVQKLSDSINSDFPDYAFYVNSEDDFAVFTSKRDSGTGGRINPYDYEYYEDIYFAHKKDGKLKKAENFELPVNSEIHDCAVGLSPDGKTIFMFVGINNGDIHYSKFNDSLGWSPPFPFSNKINSIHQETSITFNANEDTLYFVSNRTGTLGGKDIFYSTLQDSTWKTPKNIGAQINTKYDEESVFVFNDTLYFASEGHNSMGGFDIFRSTKNHTGDWGEPVNVGYPINSPFDDLFFTKSKYNSYFSSNRTGISNIFSADEILKLDTTAVKDTSEIAEADSTANDSTANVALNNKNGDNNSGNNNGNVTSDNSNKNDSTGGNNNGNTTLGRDSVIVRNIRFEINRYENKNSYYILDTLSNYLLNNPDAKIEIAGYTDTQGNYNYNLNLSKKRARFVKNYLLKKGISSSRFIAVGRGPTNQISINRDSKNRYIWKSLTYNRRVEFTITKQGEKQDLVVRQIKIPDKYKIKK